MSIARGMGLVTLFALLAGPLDADAQGRGRGNRGSRGDDGGGPAFCRSGEGHPVFGWRWCRDRGWDRANRSIWDVGNRRDRRDRRDDRVIILDPRDRGRDRDDDRDRDDRDDDRRAEPRIRWPF